MKSIFCNFIILIFFIFNISACYHNSYKKEFSSLPFGPTYMTEASIEHDTAGRPIPFILDKTDQQLSLLDKNIWKTDLPVSLKVNPRSAACANSSAKVPLNDGDTLFVLENTNNEFQIYLKTENSILQTNLVSNYFTDEAGKTHSLWLKTDGLLGGLDYYVLLNFNDECLSGIRKTYRILAFPPISSDKNDTLCNAERPDYKDSSGNSTFKEGTTTIPPPTLKTCPSFSSRQLGDAQGDEPHHN